MENQHIYDSNDEILLKDIVNILWRYKALIIGLTLGLVLLALAYSGINYGIAKPGVMYESEAVISIKTDDTIPHQKPLFLSVLSGDEFIKEATKTLDGGSNYSSRNVVVNNDTETGNISIKTSHSNANTANKIVDAIVNQAIVVTNDSIKGVKVSHRSFARTVTTLYTTKPLPNFKVNVAISFIAGLMLSFFLIFIIEFLFGKVKESNQLESALNTDVLAITPLPNGSNKKSNLSIIDSTYLGSDYQINQLALKLIGSQKQTFAFSHVNECKNKQQTLNELSTALSKLHKSVCLISFDTNAENNKVLSDYFVNQAILEDAIIKDDGYHQITLKFGNQSSEILSSPEFRVFLDTLKQNYDLIIVDSFNFKENIDSLLIAHLSEEVVLIVDANKNTTSQLEDLLSILNKHNVNVFGAILNNYKIVKPLIK